MSNLDENDAWIADYLDWLDTLASHSASTKNKVDQFLMSSGRTVSAQVRQVLLEFAGVHEPITELSATVALDWIDAGSDPNHELTNELLPRPFGEYTLLDVIGRGGMGIVYRATQSSLERSVCIKLAPAGMEERSRLVREAKLAGELQHPNIVGVFDAGTLDGRAFIAMEFVAGQPLSSLLASTPMMAREAATMLISICTAVSFAHQKQILHRDLKPSNVMIGLDGRPRVTDFGLAKRMTGPKSSVSDTLTGIAGSPSYMAPEQVRNDELSVRTDVYGLGAILYEMLSGRPPLVGNTPLETMRLVETTEPVELGRLVVGLPKDLETICHKCLEKRPLSRYANVDDLHDDLKRFLDGIPVLARPIGRFVRTARWMYRNQPLSIAATVVFLSLLCTIAVGGWMLSQTREALEKTNQAESSQRSLAGELRKAVQSSNQSLYRSQIIQASQAFSANDIVSARKALSEIESNEDLRMLARMEFEVLYRRAWPAEVSFGPKDSQIVDFNWSASSQSLFVLTDSAAEAAKMKVVDRSAHQRWIAERSTTLNQRWTAERSTTIEHSVTPLQSSHFRNNSQLLSFSVHPVKDLVAIHSQSELEVLGPDSTELLFLPELLVPIREVIWHPRDAVALAISRSGNSITRIDVSSREQYLLFSDLSAIRKVSFAQYGSLLAMIGSNQIEIWRWDSLARDSDEDVATPNEPDAVLALESWPVDLVWVDDKTLAVIDELGTLSTFEVGVQPAGGRRLQPDWNKSISVTIPVAMCFANNQFCIVGDKQITGIDRESGLPMWSLGLPLHAKIRFNPFSKAIAVQEQGTNTVQFLNANQLATPTVISSAGVPIRRAVSGNSGQTIAWRDVDGTVTAENASWNSPRIQFSESPQPGTGIAISPIDDLMAVTRQTDVIVCRLPEANEVHRLSHHQSTVWSLCFDKTGRMLASGDSDGNLFVTDMESGTAIQSIKGLHGDIRAIAFTTDGRRLLVADASTQLKHCDVLTGQVQPLNAIEGATIHAIAVLDGETVAAADSMGRITLLRLDKSDLPRSWLAHSGPIWSISSSRDRILSASQDGTLKVWDTSGNLLTTLVDLKQPIWSIEYDPLAKHLVGSTTQGIVFTLKH